MPRQVVVLTATKMADGSSLKHLWPVELQLLEAEYENSKLQVRLDTLECHKSIAELDVLCQEETLRKKKRENNELSKYRNGLEVCIYIITWLHGRHIILNVMHSFMYM